MLYIQQVWMMVGISEILENEKLVYCPTFFFVIGSVRTLYVNPVYIEML